jgi:hypothetical protein
MTDLERAVTDIGESIRRDIDANAVEAELPVTARAPDKPDLALFPSRPRAAHSPADIDEATLTRALEADVRRDFAGLEDSLVRFEDDAGNIREVTVREMLEVLGLFPERSLEMMEGILREAQARGAVTETGRKVATLHLISGPTPRTCATCLTPYPAS